MTERHVRRVAYERPMPLSTRGSKPAGSSPFTWTAMSSRSSSFAADGCRGQNRPDSFRARDEPVELGNAVRLIVVDVEVDLSPFPGLDSGKADSCRRSSCTKTQPVAQVVQPAISSASRCSTAVIGVRWFRIRPFQSRPAWRPSLTRECLVHWRKQADSTSASPRSVLHVISAQVLRHPRTFRRPTVPRGKRSARSSPKDLHRVPSS